MRRSWLLLLPLLLQTPARAQAPFPAGRYRLDPQHARISWSVSHLGFSLYRGLIPSVHGTLAIDPRHPEAAVLDADIAMGGIATLDPALDSRLRGPQFLRTALYPTASYHAAGLRMTGAGTARVDGELSLCGVALRVPMNVRFQRAGHDPVNGSLTLGFEGTSVLRRSLFGVAAYAPFIGDDVALEVEAEFVPDSGGDAH